MIFDGETPPQGLMLFVDFCMQKIADGYPTIILSEQLRKIKQNDGLNQHVISYYMSIDFSKPEYMRELQAV